MRYYIADLHFYHANMNTRDVGKRDCIQLFLAAYNLCDIMDDI